MFTDEEYLERLSMPPKAAQRLMLCYAVNEEKNTQEPTHIKSGHLIHRLAPHTPSLSLIPRPTHIVNPTLRIRRRQIIDPLLALHARRIRLTDAPRTRSQMQSIGSNELLALGRDPLGALAGRDVHDVHGVDFLEGAAAGLAEEEVDDDGAEEVAGREDVAVAVVDGAGDEGGEEGDEEVPDPVALGEIPLVYVIGAQSHVLTPGRTYGGG
jgi:hypothetical protein